jgi:hypothetical protein
VCGRFGLPCSRCLSLICFSTMIAPMSCFCLGEYDIDPRLTFLHFLSAYFIIFFNVDSVASYIFMCSVLRPCPFFASPHIGRRSFHNLWCTTCCSTSVQNASFTDGIFDVVQPSRGGIRSTLVVPINESFGCLGIVQMEYIAL